MNSEQALSAIQSNMTSDDWIWLINEYEKMLPNDALFPAHIPATDIEGRCNYLGHCLYLTMKRTAPDEPESLHLGLPYAFSRLLLDRMRKKAN
jgi:hypothetical protein